MRNGCYDRRRGFAAARCRFHFLATVVAFAWAPAQLGCGARDYEPGGAPEGMLGAPDPETRQIQEFLDSRYTRADLKHSFRTRFGETVDCIDFFAQPGVKALAAMGEPITEIPTPPPLSAVAAGQYRPTEFEFDGSSDEDGNRRECPPDGVPIIRVTADGIRAVGGLGVYLNPRLDRRAPPHPQHAGSPAPPRTASGGSSLLPAASVCTQEFGIDYPEYAHVQETFNNADVANITQAFTQVSLPPPVFPLMPSDASEPHSITQIWVYTGYGANFDGCTCGTAGQPPCTQSVEVGWEIDAGPSIRWPTNPPAPQSPHLAIFSTNGGYGPSNSCFAHLSCPAGAPVFVGYPGAKMTAGMILPTSAPGGAPSELWMQAVNGTAGGIGPNGWWIATGINVGNSPPTISLAVIGYYASTFFTGAMKTSAQTFQVGGEIRDPTSTWVIPMGTAGTTSSGYPHASYVRSASACNTSCQNSYSPMAGANGFIQTVPGGYNGSKTLAAAPGPGGWTNGFYYGSVPKVFWQQNYGYTGTDWSIGNYKGQCGTGLNSSGQQALVGQPIIGLSAYTQYVPGSQQAHAIQCNTTTVPTTPSSCYGRAFNPSNNTGTSEDWDSGYAKAGCRSSEFVEGVSQSLSGQINGILCCPSTKATHTGCSTQIFYGQNSSAYYNNAGSDWDWGYDKGQCPAGDYVAGVSGIVASSQGVVGAPHAILCCPLSP
jgi:hypothetical protein